MPPNVKVYLKNFYLGLPVVSVVESWPLPPDPIALPGPDPAPKLSECPPDEHWVVSNPTLEGFDVANIATSFLSHSQIERLRVSEEFAL